MSLGPNPAPAAQDCDPSDYERPPRLPRPRGVRGVVRLDGATVAVTLAPVSGGGWRASAVLEVSSEAFGATVPTAGFQASTPREAWAALSSEIYRQLGVFR